MAEDWAGIAAEVDAAIKSIGSTDEGFPCTVRVPPAGVPAGPGEPPSGEPTYFTITVVDDRQRQRDINGTLVGTTRRTLTAGALSGVPTKACTIAVGIKAEDAGPASPWEEILEVRPLSPAGVTLLYEIDLAT